MKEREEFVVGGFLFGSEADANLAREEEDRIEILEGRLDYQNPEAILAVYHKAIENRIFSTPVGFSYMRKLQIFLYEAGFLKDEVRAVPLYHIFGSQLRDEVNIPKRRIAGKKQVSLKPQLRMSVILNMVLIAVVIVMFVITLKGDNPNMLNYEAAIQNKYAAWEEELTQRENEIRQKEQEKNSAVKE